MRCPTHCDSSMDAGDKCTCVPSRERGPEGAEGSGDSDARAVLTRSPSLSRLRLSEPPPRATPRRSCGCPKELWGGKNASQILHESGIARIFPQLDLAWVDGEWNDGAADEVIDMLCRVGHPGEMFTSAAPAARSSRCTGSPSASCSSRA